MNIKQKGRQGLVCLVCMIGVTGPAWANNTTRDKTLTMDAIVVSATREEAKALDVPGSVVFIDQEALNRSQAITLKDAIDDIPNVDFDNTSMGPIQRPSIRGLDQNQIIIKIDGVRQTFRGTGGIGRNPGQVDAYLLKGIEVLRGPGSSLHGSGGMGGVIAMETKDASDFLDPGKKLGYTLRGGFQSATEDYSGALAVYGNMDGTDILGAGTYHNIGDFRSSSPELGSNKADRDGYSGSGLFKVSTHVGTDHKLGVSLNTYQDKLETKSSLYHSKQQQITGSWDWIRDDGLADLKANIQFTNRKDEMENPLRKLKDDFHSFGFDVYNTFSGTLSSNTKWKLTLGTDGAFDYQEGTDFGVPDPSRPDAEARDLGGFSRLHVNMFDTFSLIPSLRYTYYEREAKNTTAENQSDHQWSPQITAQWSPAKWVNLFCSYAETYRAPTMDEIYFEMEYPMPPGMPAIRVVPNPNLSPETAKTFEGGFGLVFDDLTGNSDQLRFKAVSFTEHVYGFITASSSPIITPQGNEYTSINVGKVRRYGVELEMDYLWGPFTFHAAYGMVNGEDKDSDEKTGSVPQNLLLSCNWHSPVKAVSLYWKSQFVDSADYVLYQNRNQVPGYAIHGLGAVWTPAVSWAQGLRVDIGVDNLFSREYLNYRGGTDKGLNFKLACTLSF